MPTLLLKHFKSDEEKLEAYRAEVDIDHWPQSIKDLLIDEDMVDCCSCDDVDTLIEDISEIYKVYSDRMKTPFNRIMDNFTRPFELSEYPRLRSEAIQIYNEHAKEMKSYYEDAITDIETIKKAIQIITEKNENKKVKTLEKKIKSLKNNMYEQISNTLFNGTM